MRKPLIIAHRGAAGHAPENTMASFKKAIELEADGIELDVHLSKDGYIMVCHDERIDRTTNGRGFVKDLTKDEIQQYDAGSWYGEKYKGEKIPTLEEVFELIREEEMILNIELKNDRLSYPGIEGKVNQLIKAHRMTDRTIVSSFNHDSLVQLKRINRMVYTGVLYVGGIQEPWAYARKLWADAIHPFYYNVTPEIVLKCRQMNIAVNPYTVNEEHELLAIAQMGVTGIITDYPDRGKRALERLNFRR